MWRDRTNSHISEHLKSDNCFYMHTGHQRDYIKFNMSMISKKNKWKNQIQSQRLEERANQIEYSVLHVSFTDLLRN